MYRHSTWNGGRVLAQPAPRTPSSSHQSRLHHQPSLNISLSQSDLTPVPISSQTSNSGVSGQGEACGGAENFLLRSHCWDLSTFADKLLVAQGISQAPSLFTWTPSPSSFLGILSTLPFPKSQSSCELQ